MRRLLCRILGHRPRFNPDLALGVTFPVVCSCCREPLWKARAGRPEAIPVADQRRMIERTLEVLEGIKRGPAVRLADPFEGVGRG